MTSRLAGGPSDGQYNSYWGARLWHDSGVFRNHGFKGLCAVFVTAAFSFAGTELVGLAAAESANPVRALPGATARYAGFNGFDHNLNVVILLSVLSIGVSCVYLGSRTLTALAQKRYATKVGLGLYVIVLTAQFFVAVAPPDNSGDLNDAEGFFKPFLTVPVVLLFWDIDFIFK